MRLLQVPVRVDRREVPVRVVLLVDRRQRTPWLLSDPAFARPHFGFSRLGRLWDFLVFVASFLLLYTRLLLPLRLLQLSLALNAGRPPPNSLLLILDPLLFPQHSRRLLRLPSLLPLFHPLPRPAVRHFLDLHIVSGFEIVLVKVLPLFSLPFADPD